MFAFLDELEKQNGGKGFPEVSFVQGSTEKISA